MNKIKYCMILCKYIKFEYDYLGGCNLHKATINSIRYSRGGSLNYHKDLAKLNSNGIGIYHAEKKLNTNVKLYNQIKYLSFCGRINQPIYSGLMISTPVKSLLCMGSPASTNYFHGVPPIRSSKETSVQFRSLNI